jgi:hypothetical protein
MARSLVFGAPCQLSLLAGQEHGRTIPLAVFGNATPQPVKTSVQKY